MTRIFTQPSRSRHQCQLPEIKLLQLAQRPHSAFWTYNQNFGMMSTSTTCMQGGKDHKISPACQRNRSTDCEPTRLALRQMSNLQRSVLRLRSRKRARLWHNNQPRSVTTAVQSYVHICGSLGRRTTKISARGCLSASRTTNLSLEISVL